MSQTQRTLALQLERLTREAAGFKAKMAAVSRENTRLTRELAAASAKAERDALAMRRMDGELAAAHAELRRTRDQRDADARRDANEQMQMDAKVARLSAELKDARRELGAQDRWMASSEHTGGLRDAKLEETSSLANSYDLELTQLKAAYLTRTHDLAHEETQRRRAEGDLAAARELMQMMVRLFTSVFQSSSGVH